MFKAFVSYADDTTKYVSSLPDLKKLPQDQNDATVWIDLEEPSEQELMEVGKAFDLDEAALEDCLQGEQRPRIDEFETYIFLVLYGMYGVDEDQEVEPRKLAAFCGEHFLITVHREPLRTLRDVRARCERHASHVLGRGVTFLLYTLIDGLVDKYGLVVSQYEDQLEDLEQMSLHAQAEHSLMQRVFELRMQLLDLRRVALAQKELLNPLAKGEYQYLSENLEQRFLHVRDHLTQVLEEINDFRDRLRYVVDNHRAALAQQMNAIVKVLTIFSAILLPLTFIAGVYGMNFDKSFWPPSDFGWSFAGVLFFMTVLALGLLLVFRVKKWL